MAVLLGVRRTNVAADLYVRALTSLYKRGHLVYDPDYALSQDVEAYEKIRRDAVVAHALEHRKHLVAGRNWHLAPASEDPADKIAAQVVEELVKKIERFSSARFNLAEAVIRGSSYAFIHGERRPVAIAGFATRTWWIPIKLRDVDKRRFRQAIDHADVAYPKVRWELWSVEREQWEPIIEPRWFVRHVYEDAEASLGYGRGLLEGIYFYLWLKTQVLEQGAQGVERWAQGVIEASIENLRQGSTDRTNDQIAQEWLDVLEKMRSRHVIVHDKQDEFRVVEGGGEGWQIVKEMLLYLDNGLRTLILGANLPTSADKGGSYALGEIQENSTESLVQYDRSLQDETLSRDLVGLVWDLNRAELAAVGLGAAQKPRYETAQEKREDPEVSSRVVQVMIGAGIDLKADEVYEKTGFTQPGSGDAVIKGRVATAPGFDPFGDPAGAGDATFSRARRQTDDAVLDRRFDALERRLDALAFATRSPTPPGPAVVVKADKVEYQPPKVEVPPTIVNVTVQPAPPTPVEVKNEFRPEITVPAAPPTPVEVRADVHVPPAPIPAIEVKNHIDVRVPEQKPRRVEIEVKRGADGEVSGAEGRVGA